MRVWSSRRITRCRRLHPQAGRSTRRRNFLSGRILLFVGALARQHLARLTLNGERVVAEEKLLTEFGVRIPDVRQVPDGYLYVLSDDRNGKLFRVAPRQGACSLEWRAASIWRHHRHKPGLQIVARDEACHHYGVRAHSGCGLPLCCLCIQPIRCEFLRQVTHQVPLYGATAPQKSCCRMVISNETSTHLGVRSGACLSHLTPKN